MSIDLLTKEQIEIELISSNQVEIELIKTPINIAGESAYQIAVRNGFIGNELEWLQSLKTDTLEWNSTSW